MPSSLFSMLRFIFHGNLHWKDLILVLFNSSAVTFTKEAAVPVFLRAMYVVETD